MKSCHLEATRFANKTQWLVGLQNKIFGREDTPTICQACMLNKLFSRDIVCLFVHKEFLAWSWLNLLKMSPADDEVWLDDLNFKEQKMILGKVGLILAKPMEICD